MKNLTLGILSLLLSFNLYASIIYEVDINEIDVSNVGQSIQKFDLLCVENADCSASLYQHAYSSTQVGYEQIKLLTTQFSYRPIIVGGGLFLVHKDDLSISNGFLYFNVLGSTAPHELTGYASTKFLAKVATHSSVKNIGVVRVEPFINEIQAVFGEFDEEASNNNEVIFYGGSSGTIIIIFDRSDKLSIEAYLTDLYGHRLFGSNKRVGYYLDGIYVETSENELNALATSGAAGGIVI